MKKIAFAALFVGVASTGLMACGGDDDGGDITFADSGPGSDAGTGLACNPVTQQGCADGEKCSWLVVQEDPFLGRTDCVPDGTVAVGEACTEGTPGETTGFDDCAAGSLCIAATCKTICSIEPDSCAEGFACSLYTQTFSDDTNDNLGVCDTLCNPIAQDCALDTQGCYLSLFSGKATCANIAMGAEELRQSDTCLNDGSACFLNGCAEGFGAFLYAGDMMPRDCTAFCAPVDTYLDDPMGNGSGTLIGSPLGDADLGECRGARVDNTTGLQCRFFQNYFQDMNGNVLDYIPVEYGFCTPRTADTFGDCRFFSLEWFFVQYNDFIGGGGAPADYPDYITAKCNDRQGGCAAGCTSLAKEDELATTFCGKPANADSPACAAGARGAKIVRSVLARMLAERMIQAGMGAAKK